MLQNKLITKTDVQQYFQVTNTSYNEPFDQYIIQAQIDDVAFLLGEKLFNDVMQNPGSYASLLDGGSYMYNSETYYNYGLKAVISYYTYARYVYFGNIVSTSFGMVEKNHQDSRPVNDKEKKERYTKNRESAFNIWKSVENYLIRTENQLYCDNLCLREPNHSFKISKITKKHDTDKYCR